MTGNGKPKGWAYATYADDDAAAQAVELLSGKTYEGRALRAHKRGAPLDQASPATAAADKAAPQTTSLVRPGARG